MENKKKVDKQTIYRHVGSIQQVAKVRPVTYSEGRAEQMKAYEVKNGMLSFTVMGDKCLDITGESISIFFQSRDLQAGIIMTRMGMRH